jgi:hypothetical protein
MNESVNYINIIENDVTVLNVKSATIKQCKKIYLYSIKGEYNMWNRF